MNVWGSSTLIDSTGLLPSFKELLSLDFICFCIIHPVDWWFGDHLSFADSSDRGASVCDHSTIVKPEGEWLCMLNVTRTWLLASSEII